MMFRHKKQAVALSMGVSDSGLSDAAREADGMVRRKRERSLMQNVGLAAFLFGMITAALTISQAASENSVAYLVMFMAACFSVMLAAYRFQHIAVVLGALQTLSYSVYVLYAAIGNGKDIVLMDYLWLFLPMLCIASMILFMTNTKQVEKMADLLE